MCADQFLYVNYVLQYVNGHADRLQKKKYANTIQNQEFTGETSN